ncbi:lipoprotein [Pseudomonas phage UF_RH5]|uniref:Member of phage protein family found in lysis cassettes n=1 Tax=Pseudomonas phage UF_RH1 TaxID=3020045 RepID=A0AAF0BA92_9CAUD|nr:hypothetical protein P7I00_gp37 [Pseudomonas phage UF_RH1]WCF59063.1 hypothetical protein UFRH1_37 [Pseudomonas phage UF_RH1]WCZ58266.1 lipoprotein [Pseudomonas phage UF_RH5]WOK15194.1 hypothetical protein [Pseudomonas phage UF_RH9]
MNEQQFFNVAVAIIGALGGWLMRVMWQSLKELQNQDARLAEKVGNIEVLVAGQYVKRDDMDRTTAALFAKLDRIEDKLDKKADK